jgi:hypothetical protein
MVSSKTRLFFGIGTTRPILQATDLVHHLPTERRHHYADDYSMAETAKCWVAAGGRLPQSIVQLVGSDVLDTAHFEYPVKVWGGGTSMTDVMAFIPDGIIAVEGKGRETFDEEVRNWIYKEEAKNPRSPRHRLRVIEEYARTFGVQWETLTDIPRIPGWLRAIFRLGEARRNTKFDRSRRADIQIVGLPASQRRNSRLCHDQGAPLPSWSAPSPLVRGHAGAGGARRPEISDRMSANICRGTATSAIWKVT